MAKSDTQFISSTTKDGKAGTQPQGGIKATSKFSNKGASAPVDSVAKSKGNLAIGKTPYGKDPGTKQSGIPKQKNAGGNPSGGIYGAFNKAGL